MRPTLIRNWSQAELGGMLEPRTGREDAFPVSLCWWTGSSRRTFWAIRVSRTHERAIPTLRSGPLPTFHRLAAPFRLFVGEHRGHVGADLDLDALSGRLVVDQR